MALRPILFQTGIHEWDVRVSNGQFIGLIERWDMGDEYNYVFTESTGKQYVLEVGDINEALMEVNDLYEGLTIH